MSVDCGVDDDVSVVGFDVAVRLDEPSLAELTVRVFIRCGGPC
jgi:hypothetical protein